MYKDEPVSVTVPAGKYFVGDPCYVVKDEMWIEWLESADYTQNKHLIARTPDNHFAIGFGTAHGDGVYLDQYGFQYGVDAGLIGLVAYEHNPEGENQFSKVVEFKTDVIASVDENFTMEFGDITIETGDSDEDEDDDDDYEYKYDDDEDEL
jgi:hypothetical protein